MRKNFSNLTRIEKEKSEYHINIADREIDEKPLNLVGIKEENQSKA